MKYGSYGYDFEISELKEEKYGEWDLFVEGSPQGTVFHKASWLKCYGSYRFKLLALIHNETIVAGIPIVYTNRFGVKFAINPPFTLYLGIMFAESKQKYNTKLSFEKEFSKIIAKQLKGFAPYILYTFPYTFEDPTPFMENGFSVRPYYKYVLNLEKPLSSVLEDMEKDTRNRVKRAERYNLEVFEGSPAEMADLICLSFARKNKRPKYYKEEYEKFLTSIPKNTSKSIIIKNKDALLADGTVIYDNKRAYYLFAGINSEKEYKGLNQLAVWSLIKCVKDDLGLREFDMQGWPNEGIERFLRGFGGKLTHGVSIYKNNTYSHVIDTLRMLRLKLKSNNL